MDKFFIGSTNKNVSDFIVVVTQELIQQDKLAYLDYLQAKNVIPGEIELFKKQDAISLYKLGNVDVLAQAIRRTSPSNPSGVCRRTLRPSH